TAPRNTPTKTTSPGVLPGAPAETRSSGPGPDPPPPPPATPAGVGDSNNARTDTDNPDDRNRSTNDTANNECPPSSKKLSSTPTDSRPSTSANAAHSNSSCTVAGARLEPDT